jgi:DNA-binding transcriptional ArsR family regulator
MEDKKTHNTAEVKDMSLLINKPYIAFIFKKTQKIAQAVYLLSDLLDYKEPLRLSLRRSAGNLITDSVLLLKNEVQDKAKPSDNLIGSLLETLAFAESAFYLRLISEMNFLILQQEINSLIETIDFHKDSGIILSKEFLSVKNVEERPREDKGQSTSSNVFYKKDTRQSSTESFQDTKSIKDRPAEDKTERSKIIISLLKTGVELTIKDITYHLKGISEKTVQRELLSLVAQGVLKKKGERRWSRYSLK